jgi:hypothetical protein
MHRSEIKFALIGAAASQNGAIDAAARQALAATELS